MLLIAQFGAQGHAYAHREAGAPDTARQTTLVSHGACADCLAYAPLLVAAGAPAALQPLSGQTPGNAPTPRLVSLCDRGPILAFRSRAPPPPPRA